MRKVIFLFFSSTILFAQKTIFPTPLSSRIANYTIDVRLNTDKKTLDGKQLLRWTNPSDDYVSELQFHLYLNAFKNENSSFMKESGGSLRNIKIKKGKDNWGWINIVSCHIKNGENLQPKIRFYQPDDLNKQDQTVIRIPLAKPVKPHETIEIEMNFKAKLPIIFARTGFADDYFLVGQWFPKIGVYEPAGTRYATKGKWNTHQFHADTEFYADFGVYDVRMTVPKDFVLAATGVLQYEKPNADNTKTAYYRAEDVHDFAWTTSPKFVVSERQWRHVKIKAMMQPEHSGSTNRYFDAAVLALEYFDKHIGKYPHPVLTLVDPPLAGQGSSGMEYPTFITCGTVWGLPKGLRFPEMVTVHEFGHQYFQGMLASNEFEESWLDEGFNQYYEGRIMDETYGKGSQVNFWGIKVDDAGSARRSYVSMANPAISEIFREAWRYPAGTYGIMTYTKTATVLKTLENLVGRSMMDEIMQTYFIRWKFKHPSGKDFIKIANEIAERKLGKNLDWYFKQTIYEAKTCDFAVKDLQEKSFVAEQLGTMKIPTEILVKFTNGEEKLIQWSGEKNKEKFSFTKSIQSVNIDPQQKIFLDLNFINNSKSVHSPTLPALKYTAKMMFWLQNFMQFMIGFV